MSLSCKTLKILSLAAAIALVPVLSFASAQAEVQGGNLILATGGTSGTYYPFGGAMAQIWNKSIEKMNVTAQATGASKENIRLVGKGEADLAIVGFVWYPVRRLLRRGKAAKGGAPPAGKAGGGDQQDPPRQ